MKANTGERLSGWKQLLLGGAFCAAGVGPIVATAASVQLSEALGRVAGNRYEHLRTGITFEVPEGWRVVGTNPSSDNGEMVQLVRVDPSAMLSVWMVKERVEPHNIGPWLDGAPQQKVEQRNGGYGIPGAEGYRIREGSTFRATFGRHEGIVAIADYTQMPSNTAMAEYMTWIYTEKGRTFFFVRVEAKDLGLVQLHVDRIVNSAVIP